MFSRCCSFVSSLPRWLAPVLIAVLIVLDQLSKWWVFEVLLRVRGTAQPLGDWLLSAQHWSTYGAAGDFSDRVMLPFANLVMVWNRGVSFGLFAGTGGQNPYILVGVAAVIVGALCWWLLRAPNRLVAGALVLVIAGAVSNVFDRLRFGAVADFMDLHAGGYHWPAFNLADSTIVIGALLLVLDTLICPTGANSAARQPKG